MAPLSVESAVDKLSAFSRLTKHRMGLKSAEKRRVDAAFELFATGPPPAGSKGSKQKILYLEFLQRIRTLVGDAGVVFCAAGLGPSAIANMKDSDRVYLSASLKEKWNSFDTTVFQSLANGLSRDIPLASMSGDVYELTLEDIQKITAMPGQISGKIRLTDTYNKYASSFVTIPISTELTNLLTINRQRITE